MKNYSVKCIGWNLLKCFALGETWDDSHICDPDQFATVKMIGREFCSLMSLQMQKLVSKETTLTSHLWFSICMFV